MNSNLDLLIIRYAGGDQDVSLIDHSPLQSHEASVRALSEVFITSKILNPIGTANKLE